MKLEFTRRQFLAQSTAALLLPSLARAQGTAANLTRRLLPGPAPEDVTKYVNVMIGTGGHGHTYPAATVPFGAVQLGPDTGTSDWDHCSGYHFNDSAILGFSHTHLSGTGCGDLLDVLVMPATNAAQIWKKAPFSHSDEKAEPGSYSVQLRDRGILAEMTASERVGFHRYTFPQSSSSSLSVDLNHHWGTDKGAVTASELKAVGTDTLLGSRETSVWTKRKIFFALKLSKPFSKAEIIDKSHAVLHFETAANEVILAKVGISSVDEQGALANLNKEIPDWDFDRVKTAARVSWQSLLSRVQVEDGDAKKKRIFYTGLYHAMLAPTLFDDVDGRYRAMDGSIRTLPPGAHNYSTFSLWDTFRALHPLFTLVIPEKVPDFVNALIRMTNESPAGLPIWPLYGGETYCMTGYHSTSVIAEAVTKGFTGLDLASVYGPMKKRSFQDDYRGTKAYRQYGYIPAETEVESVSKTLEYSYDDWAIAHVAKKLGEDSDAKALLTRSFSYKNLFDASTGFIRPKTKSGSWTWPFDPRDIGHFPGRRDYTECNAWQTTFGIMHDPKGLIDAFGGPGPFVQKLDTLFNMDSKMPPTMPADVSGLVGQYAHGNEPCHHIAYLYSYAGEAYKTQARVASLLRDMYDDQPDGLAGNEDCGQMSAWYVMSALGFYAVDPVSGNYVFGTPLFDRVEIQTPSGSPIVLEARRSSPDEVYVQSVTFNGASYEKAWFSHADIRSGGRFTFSMGAQPQPLFGTGATNLPPSASEIGV